MTIQEKIYGSLIAAAAGDAMGAATETRSRRQILDKFGGEVTELRQPGPDVFAHGFPLGSVTDDFSLAYQTARAIIADQGVVTAATARRALLKWARTPYAALGGPTTTAAIQKLKKRQPPKADWQPAVDNSKATNGGAMKIAPAGLASGGDIDKAVRSAVILCAPTHGNSSALSAACAVAAAAAAGLKEDATLDSVIQAGIYGSQIGACCGTPLAVPSVTRRIQLALQIVDQAGGDRETVMTDLAEVVGCGLAAYEAVPTAFGILQACQGDPWEAVVMGVNIGNDTDTIATIAGAIAGALNGPDPRIAALVPQIEQANHFDLAGLAQALAQLP